MGSSNIIWDQNPILFDFGFYQLHYYSILFMVGVVLGLLLAKQEYFQKNYNSDSFDKLIFYTMAGIILGARLGHCLFYDFEYYINHPVEIFLPIQFTPNFKFVGFKGLASHGGIIGLLIALFIFSKRHKVKFISLMDMLAISAPVTFIFIRIGNFFNSEIIGKSTDVLWGVTFSRIDNIPRHPTQLYEAFSYFIIFIILFTIKSKLKNLKEGSLFGISLILLSAARFIIEFFKVNQSYFEEGLILNMGQLLSIPFFVLGILILVFNFNKKAI